LVANAPRENQAEIVGSFDAPECYKQTMILAIETSCDDTCAAVVEPDGRGALSNVVHTQTVHAR
jgi:hypothetical protein